MAKRKREMSVEKMNKWIKEGRGSGRLDEYKPWLEIHDVASLGRATRLKGWKTDRIHHLLSDLERNYFLILEWSEVVIDIREQFPLLPVEETLQIADELSIKHNADVKTKEKTVLTTDFLITVKKQDVISEVARTLKYSKDLNNYRTMEKFQIEKAYWDKKEINWGIVTEKQVSKVMAENIYNLHQSFYIEQDSDIKLRDLEMIPKLLVQKIKKQSGSIVEVTSDLDDELGLELGTSLKIFKYLIVHKKLGIDVSKRMNFNRIEVDNIVISEEYHIHNEGMVQ